MAAHPSVVVLIGVPGCSTVMLAAHTTLVVSGPADGAPGAAGEPDTDMAALLMPLAPASITTCAMEQGVSKGVGHAAHVGGQTCWGRRRRAALHALLRPAVITAVSAQRPGMPRSAKHQHSKQRAAATWST